LQQQALLWSFIDVFRWTALLAFLSALMVWPFRKITHKKEETVQLH
jgi:DHA2 family multidrug resistance protein